MGDGDIASVGGVFPSHAQGPGSNRQHHKNKQTKNNK